mgnify:CR=1
MKRKSLGLLSCVCVGLGACSDEPSEAAMHRAVATAVNKFYQVQTAAAAFLLPRGGQIPPAPIVSSVRKIDCVPDNGGGHRCNFEVGINGKPSGKMSGRFFKQADGTLAMTD